MKRRIIVMIVAVMAAGAAGACSDRAPTGAGAEGADKASPWVRPPMIDGVLRDGGGLVVRGAAGPNARVVLRAMDAAAVAVNADAAGRFDLRLPPLQPCMSYPAAPPPALAKPSRASELLTAAAAHRTFAGICLGGQQQLMEEQMEEDEQQQLADLMEEQMTGEDAVDIAISLGMPH